MADKPKLKDGVTFARMATSARSHRYLITTGGGRQFQASEKLVRLLELMDGTRDLDELAKEASPLLDVKLDSTQMASLIEKRINPHGLLEADGEKGSLPEEKGGEPRSPLTFALPLFSAKAVRPLAALFQHLFYPALLITLTAISLLLHLAVYLNLSAYRVDLRTLQGGDYLAIFTLVLASVLFHELGHVSACRRYGCQHGPIGLGFYLIFPVCYADVNDAWRLSRRARLAIDYAGIYFQLIAIILLYGAFLVTGSRHALLAIFAIDALLITSLQPFFRFDGYWIASDLLGIPNLRQRSTEALQHLVDRLARRPSKPSAQLSQIGGMARLSLYLYAISSHLFFFGFTIWMVLILGPNLILDYPAFAGNALLAMGRAAADRNVFSFLNHLLGLFYTSATVLIVLSLFAHSLKVFLNQGRRLIARGRVSAESAGL